MCDTDGMKTKAAPSYKPHRYPAEVITDKLASYAVAKRELLGGVEHRLRAHAYKDERNRRFLMWSQVCGAQLASAPLCRT